MWHQEGENIGPDPGFLISPVLSLETPLKRNRNSLVFFFFMHCCVDLKNASAEIVGIYSVLGHVEFYSVHVSTHIGVCKWVCVREETCKPEYILKGTKKGVTWQRGTERKAFYRIKTNKCLQWKNGRVAQNSTWGQYCHLFIVQLICWKSCKVLSTFFWGRISIMNRIIATSLKFLRLL